MSNLVLASSREYVQGVACRICHLTVRASLRRRFSFSIKAVRYPFVNSCERGSALVEIALVLPLAVAMLVGIIEISLALYTFEYLADAAREGSRYAIVRGADSCVNTPYLQNCNATASQIQNYVKSLGYPQTEHMTAAASWKSASSTRPTTWATCQDRCNAAGNLVKVVVTYNFPLDIPFVPSTTIHMSSTSQKVIMQ
jgi:Flp pilus assembly protein TadG